MTSVKNKPFKWSLDFNRSKYEKCSDIVSPPGYSQSAGQNSKELLRNSESSKLIIKKSWDIALGPLKQVPMNLFVMYMAGNSISIFPIMMIGMLIVQPVKVLFKLQKTFENIKGTQAWGQKFIFFIGNCVNIALALYKCHYMGLFPTHASDWLTFINPPRRLEYSGGGFVLS